MEKVHTVRTYILTKTCRARHREEVKNCIELMLAEGYEIQPYMPTKISEGRGNSVMSTELHYFLPVLTPVK